MHHIISDGTSMGVLVNEFMRLYNGEKLPPLRTRYKDFSRWQNSKKEQESIKRQEKYWLKEFAGEIPVLNLPADIPRPAIQDFSGGFLAFEIGKEETQKMKDLALTQGVTLYMVLLALFNVLLARLSGQEEIVVGSPEAGRRHPDLEQIIGMFVNTLALKNYLPGEKTVKELIGEIKEKTLEARENQDYPYEELVEEVAITRDAGRNPLFDTMFVMQNMDIPKIEIPGLKLAPDEHPIETSKFDLTLIGREVKEKLLLDFEYSTNLFKKATIERFSTYLKKIASTAVDNPDVKICDVEIILEEEKRQVLYDFNNTTAEYPKDKVLHELFAEQAGKSPDSMAVIGPAQSAPGHREPWAMAHAVTYRELNEKSNQLAHLLRQKGVQPDTIAAIMVERSIEMIVGILGILKAGGTYLPINPENPVERIKCLLEDSSANVLVTVSPNSTLAEEDLKLRRLDTKKNIETVFLDFFEFSNFPSSQLFNFSFF
jgi:non-ribosomal peptide synthetase component F